MFIFFRSVFGTSYKCIKEDFHYVLLIFRTIYQIKLTGTEVCIIHIYLDERDLRDDTWHDLKPNGFTESRSVNDFPVRDRKVVLHIRRRRWLDSNGSNTIINYDGIVAECTSYSKEFADALKKIFGYIPDSGPFSGAVL